MGEDLEQIQGETGRTVPGVLQLIVAAHALREVEPGSYRDPQVVRKVHQQDVTALAPSQMPRLPYLSKTSASLSYTVFFITLSSL